MCLDLRGVFLNVFAFFPMVAKLYFGSVVVLCSKKFLAPLLEFSDFCFLLVEGLALTRVFYSLFSPGAGWVASVPFPEAVNLCLSLWGNRISYLYPRGSGICFSPFFSAWYLLELYLLFDNLLCMRQECREVCSMPFHQWHTFSAVAYMPVLLSRYSMND